MYKSILCCIVCCLLAVAVHGQSRFSIGPEVGFGAAGLPVARPKEPARRDNFTSTNLVGLHLGASGYRLVGRHWSVRAGLELQFCTQRTASHYSIRSIGMTMVNYSEQAVDRYAYLHLPLGWAVQLGGKGLRHTFQVGLRPAFLIGLRSDYDFVQNDVPGTGHATGSRLYLLDRCLLYGAARYEMSFKAPFFIAADYAYLLAGVANPYVIASLQVHGQARLAVGYRFGLGQKD